MPFMQALPAALDGLLLRAVFPVWLISFTKQGRQALRGYTEMEVSHPRISSMRKLKHWPQKYMVEMIEDRKTSTDLEERRDILSNLIRASLEKTVPQKDFEFGHRDLLGDIFIFLFAGKLFGFQSSEFAIEL
jgi:cytochrome P450